MLKLGRLIQNYSNSFIYALGVTIGIYISIEELHKFNDTNKFIFFSILIFIILFFENLIAILKKDKEIEINLDINDDVNELWHIFYKFFIPLIYYISLVVFGYFNFYSSSIYILLIITFFTFFILFINTRAFFQDIKKLESKTHYVYDLIKFLFFFTTVNIFSHLQFNQPNYIFLFSIILSALTFVLINLMVWRINKIYFKAITLSLIGSIIIGLLYGFLNLNLYRTLNPLQISLGLVFAFYLCVAIIHHSLLNTLSKSVVLEYVVIIVVIFSVIYGIS